MNTFKNHMNDGLITYMRLHYTRIALYQAKQYNLAMYYEESHIDLAPLEAEIKRLEEELTDA